MNSTSALIPVVLIIACGWMVGRLGWIRAEHLPGLANVVFLVLTPALMFRSMSKVGLADLDYYPIAIYLGVAATLFLSVSVFLGRTQRAYVIALACIFSNQVMIGIPLISLAYGAQALVVLITLISVHALVLLSFATLLLEWQVAKIEVTKQARQNAAYKQLFKVLVKTAYRAIAHPVILPIVVGLLWGVTGIKIPQVIDNALLTMGQANGAMSLILVGATLAHTRVKDALRGAFYISIIKNILMPAAVFAVAWLFGVRGLQLAVITVVAGLPIGNNVYLFSARYGQAQNLVTASMAMTNLMSVLTLAGVMSVLSAWFI